MLMFHLSSHDFSMNIVRWWVLKTQRYNHAKKHIATMNVTPRITNAVLLSILMIDDYQILPGHPPLSDNPIEAMCHKKSRTTLPISFLSMIARRFRHRGQPL